MISLKFVLNAAIDFMIFGTSNANNNNDESLRLDSGGDPTTGTNSGKIAYYVNGLDKCIITGYNLIYKFNWTGCICFK